MSFFQHTGSIKKKISRAIGIFYKIRNFVTKSILIIQYYSLIYPFLIYAVHIWGGTSDMWGWTSDMWGGTSDIWEGTSDVGRN